MQLKHLSIALSALLIAHAEDNTIQIQTLQYTEADDRVEVGAVTIGVKYNFNLDNLISADFTYDAVGGATPTWVNKNPLPALDAVSSASGVSSKVNNGSINAVMKEGNNSVANADKSYENVSFEDERKAFNLSWVNRDEDRDETVLALNYSSEVDFTSLGGGIERRIGFNNQNTILSVGIGLMKNRYEAPGSGGGDDDDYGEHDDDDDYHIVVEPVIDPANYDVLLDPVNSGESTTLSVQVGIWQALAPNMALSAAIFGTKESGYLDNPHGTIFRAYTPSLSGVEGDFLFSEKRPDKRTTRGGKVSFFGQWLGVTLQTIGRYTDDDWGMTTKTAEVNGHLPIGRKLALRPLYRHYEQTAVDFYRADGEFGTLEEDPYASSDFRLGKMSAETVGMGLDIKSGKLTYNFSYYRYEQSSGLKADWMGAGFSYRF